MSYINVRGRHLIGGKDQLCRVRLPMVVLLLLGLLSLLAVYSLYTVTSFSPPSSQDSYFCTSHTTVHSGSDKEYVRFTKKCTLLKLLRSTN
jgi:hypothetical protein